MCGDEFKCTFSTFEWNELLRMFVNEVKAKRYHKLDYDSWRELKEISESMETWDLVRVYWNDDYDHYALITVYIDSKANGKPDMPFEFDSGDSSFGSFLYELELYREEKEQMRVKDHYANQYETYEPVKQYALGLKDAGKLGVGKLTVLNDEADVEFCTGYNPDTKINTNNEKEKTVMKFNFDFGPVNSQVARLSIYGLAIKNKVGTYVSYDPKAKDLVDVDVLNFDGAKFLYKMPVAIKDIAIGDVIVHQNVPMFVIAIAINDGYITAIDPVAGERKDVMLTKSPFGFNFATKVVNLLGNLNGGATSDNPFGNLGLMLMLGDGNKDMGDLLPLMMATGNGGALGNMDMSNPLMMYLILGHGTMDKFLPLMFLANNTNNAVPTHTCTCGGHCVNPAGVDTAIGNHSQG